MILAYVYIVYFPFDRVSSVLNRDVKQFGKKYMFDSNEETCWNSDQVSFKMLISCTKFNITRSF